MAGIHFVRKATTWFKAYEKVCGKVLLWSDFIATLCARFNDKAILDPIVELKKLKQTRSLKSYLEEFDTLLSKADLSESQAISHFLEGLKHEVELSVRLFRPTTLQDAYGLAKVQDLLWNTKSTPSQTPKPYTKPYTTQTHTPTIIKTSVNPHQFIESNKLPALLRTPPHPEKPMKTLTTKEMEERRQKVMFLV